MRRIGTPQVSPPSRRHEWVESPTLPLPPPRDRQDLDRFLDDLGAVPVGDLEGVRRMFAELPDRERVVAVVAAALSERPCGDVGRFMMLLSCAGELADQALLEPLHQIVWAADDELVAPQPQAPAGQAGCMFPHSGLIQSRAAEMFAWIAATGYDDRLLTIIRDHAIAATRLAAADAYLYAHGDDAAALETVRAAARDDDRDRVGVPRWVRGMERAAFDRAVEVAVRAAGAGLPPQTTLPQDREGDR